MCLYLDSSAARGILSGKGIGRLRHLSCRVLWLQDLVSEWTLMVKAVLGAVNPADIATKRPSAARIGRSLVWLKRQFSWCMGSSQHLSSCEHSIKTAHHEHSQRLWHTVSVDTTAGMHWQQSFFVFSNGCRARWVAVCCQSGGGMAAFVRWIWCLLEMQAWERLLEVLRPRMKTLLEWPTWSQLQVVRPRAI